MRTSVGIHVVTWDDVDSDVARRSGDVAARPPRECDGRFATAVVKQVDVGVSEVTVDGAVQEVVDAGFAECQPSQVIE